MLSAGVLAPVVAVEVRRDEGPTGLTCTRRFVGPLAWGMAGRAVAADRSTYPPPGGGYDKHRVLVHWAAIPVLCVAHPEFCHASPDGPRAAFAFRFEAQDGLHDYDLGAAGRRAAGTLADLRWPEAPARQAFARALLASAQWTDTDAAICHACGTVHLSSADRSRPCEHCGEHWTT